MICDRKVSLSKNVHTDESIDIPVEGYLSDPYHCEHDPVRETNIDQVAGGRKRSAADSHIRRADRS